MMIVTDACIGAGRGDGMGRSWEPGGGGGERKGQWGRGGGGGKGEWGGGRFIASSTPLRHTSGAATGEIGDFSCRDQQFMSTLACSLPNDL